MRKELKNLIPICLFCLITFSVFGRQQSGFFDHFGQNEGLASQNVLSVFCDSKGFIWVGSEAGLHRFDGYEFRSFPFAEGEEPLGKIAIGSLAEDGEGRIWASAGSEGLLIFSPETEQISRLVSGRDWSRERVGNTINFVTADSKGRIWFGGKAINFIAAGEREVRTINYQSADTRDNRPPQCCLLGFAETTEGRLFGFGTARTGFFEIVDPEKGVLRHHWQPEDTPNEISDHVSALLAGPNGKLWIAAQNKITLYDPAKDSYQIFPTETTGIEGAVRTMTYAPDGTIWLGTVGQGILVFNPKTARVQQQLTTIGGDPLSLSYTVVQNFCIGPDRSVYVALWGGGLNRIRPESLNIQRITHHFGSKSPALLNELTQSVLERKNGEVWISSELGGISVFKPNQLDFEYITDTLRTGPISKTGHLQEDSDGNMWIQTASGLHVLGPDKQLRGRTDLIYNSSKTEISGLLELWKVNNKPDSLRLIHHLYGKENNSVFLRMLVSDKHRKVYLFNKKNPLHNLNTEFMRLDKRQRVWVGSLRNGLFVYDPFSGEEKHFLNNSEKGSLPTNRVFSAEFGPKGEVWIATPVGLFRFDEKTEKFSSVFGPNNIFRQAVFSVRYDQKKRLWLAAEKGLYSYNIENQHVEKYDKQDGLASLQFKADGMHLGPTGKMYVWSLDVVHFFHPDSLQKSEDFPIPVLTDLLLFNKKVQVSPDSDFEDPDRISVRIDSVGEESFYMEKAVNAIQKITLTAEQNMFGFNFAALAAGRPEEVRFAYRLEGFDKDFLFTDAGNRRVVYTNVPYGAYVFRLRIYNGKKHRDKTLTVNILPPWYWSKPARVFYLLLFFGLVTAVILAVRWSIRKKQQELEKEREISEKLRRTDRLKDEFLANTSHELRTPLNGIIGLAESLADGIAGPQNKIARENLDMIVSSGKRLSNLVNDILDFSKMKNNDLVLDLRPCDLYSSVQIVFFMLKPLVQNKELFLLNSLSEELPAVRADENRLQQILYNLIGNAIKFTEKGKVEISAKNIDNQQIEIQILDTGIGIPDKDLERIFESFEQGDGSVSRDYGGTGIGLAVTKKLIKLQGGTLGVKSEVGRGSTFFFRLPVSIDKASKTELKTEAVILAERPESSPASFQNEEKGLKILITDDEPVNLQVLDNLLSMQGFQVFKASGGLEALEIIDKTPDLDLMILDVMMPRMSGYEVSRKIREKIPAHRLPIIMLTAKNRSEDSLQGFRAGANDYLSKPLEKDELLARLDLHRDLLMANRALEDYGRSLEKKVLERTEEVMSQKNKLELSGKILEKNVAKLQIANQKLAELNDFKELMTGMIAHDIKNPLNTIMALSRQKPSAGSLGKMNDEARRILLLISNMLDVQKFEKAEVRIQSEPVNPVLVMEAAREQMAALAAEKSLQIEQKTETGFFLSADRELCERILVNLLTNACKFSPLNGKVELHCRAENEFVLLSVSDRGPGIPEALQAGIFERFVQAEVRDSGAGGSTGLGLTFCKLATESMGGKLLLESLPGLGSTFTVRLPKSEVSADFVPEKTITSSSPQSLPVGILPFRERLLSLDFSETSDVLAVLTEIPRDSPEIITCVTALERAVFNLNPEAFRLILQSKTD